MAVPVLIGGAVAGALLAIVGSIVARVLVALGVGFITFTGITLAFDQIKNLALQNLQGLPSDLLGLLAYMNVGTAINIIFSAYAIRFTLIGLDKATGKVTRPVFGRKG